MTGFYKSITGFCSRLTEAGFRHFIGGSVAAGVWGEPRFTRDVDLLVWLDASTASRFVSCLTEPLEVTAEEVDKAVSSHDRFECVHVLDTIENLRFDCFLAGRSPIDEEAYGRSQLLDLTTQAKVRVSCAEHILVMKLQWYKLGNRTSEQHWRDMLGIVSVSDLDWALVDRWSALTDVQDVLEGLPRPERFG